MIQSFETTIHDVAHHFDELDSFYRDLWGTELHHGLWIKGNETKEQALLNLSEKVLSYLGDLKGKNLVDIGCGYGGTSRFAANKGAEKITAITLSARQFQYARNNSADYPINYILGDWLQNSIPDHTFDSALSIECFAHIPKKKKFFDEVYRTLKPGSRFVMTAWMTGENLSSFDKSMILEPICIDGRLPSLCNKKEVIELISSSGLQFIEHVDLSSRVSRTWFLALKKIMGLAFMTERKERDYALSILRILLGYKKGCFRYGLFVMKKS